MSKYIIKNCENLLYCTSCKEYECAIADDFGYKRKCSDNNNCKMKQIVELAKGHTEPCKNCEQQIKECDCSDICNAYRLDKILKLLDLQEVE